MVRSLFWGGLDKEEVRDFFKQIDWDSLSNLAERFEELRSLACLAATAKSLVEFRSEMDA